MADPIANPPIGPLGLIGNVPVPSIDTRTEEEYFKDVTTPTGLKPVQPGAATPTPPDPWASFQDAGFDQFQDAPDEFSNFKTADDLDIKSVEDLDKDRDNFHPADYFSNNPDVSKDPKKLQKLLEVYRRRDEEGLTAKGVAAAAVKNTPGLVSDIAGGIKRLGERAIDVVVQPTANVILGTLTGDLFDDQRREALFNETRKVIKKGVSEVGAGSEAATVGLVDLARTGIGKLPESQVAFPGRFTPPTGAPLPEKKKTDQQLLAQLSDDVSFRQVVDDAMRGEGEAAQIAGLDKETLSKQGIEIDENAIRQLSLVDPISMVATGGAFKLVGIGGKVLGTAATLEGAQQFADKLAKVAKFSAGKAIQGTGFAARKVREKLQGSGRSAALITGIGAATQGAGAVESLALGAATKAIGPVVRKAGALAEHAGKALAGEVPVSANLGKVLDYAGKATDAAGTVTKGAFQGLAAGAPFAIAAQEDETAGSLLGAGAALGAAGGAGAGALRVVKRSAARRYFDQNRPVLPDVPSPDYGRDARLDGIHRENIQKLSAQDASELNNFREGLRQQGGEFYAMDRPTWRAKMEEVFPDATPEQLDIYENHSAFFDQTLGDRKVVYLNADTKGLHHDAGHIFDAVLAPEKRAELRKAVSDTFGQKAIDDFKATYERQVGSKITDSAALDEFIAEQFSALFNNVPVTELAAPRGLITKFIDTIAEGAESLGINLTSDVSTPDLGAPVNIGIRQLFRNAAGDVMRANIEGVPPTNITPFPGGPEPTPGPVAPAPTAPPTNVTPLPGTPSRNIRVGPENVAAFKQSASPDVRAAADARARETGVDYARAEAKKDDGSSTSRVIENISDSMESGRPVVQIEHLGITSASTPEAPLGRTPRRSEQAAGYAALEAAQLATRQGAPPEIVSQHSKNFVPVRWTDQGGTPTLIAMSLDKVIANILKVAADPKAKDLIPYPVENGKLTAEGWREVVADAQAYSENQANGRKGDGGRLNVPEAGLSIPAENPAYTPQPLSPERANFQNLVQGLAPPQTARAQKGAIPGNVKGQILAEANLRPTETPANVTAKRADKQAFVDFPGRTVQEVNPLRNELERRGVKTRELIEVTERIRAKDIVSAEARPEVNYSAPVTDTIRGGFLPAPTEFRQKNLGGRTVEEFSDYILKATPEEWKAATDNMTGGLTGGAWNLGLGLKDAGDVGVLKAFQDKLSEATKAAMKSGDFDGAYSLVSKGQFFREAYEAATGTGSAGAAFKRGTAGMESAKPPFPIEEGGAGFLPAEQLEVGTAESTPPKLRVLPAAPGGRPPIEPPGLRPPPVAAAFLPAEELEAEPEVRVLPNALVASPQPSSSIPIAAFLPKTDAGKELEEKGFEVVPSGELGVRRVAIERDGEEVAVIQSVQRAPKTAEIAMVQKYPGAPEGVGEVLYREIGAPLKADGVTEVTGNVVSPEPLAIRRKVFGEPLVSINGEPATFEQAVDTAARIQNRTENEVAAIEPVSTISPSTQFLPKVKRDAQGRPLKKNGDIDYPKWQAEGIARRKQQEREIENYVPVEKVGPKSSDEPKATGWILPNKKFVSLDTNFHEQYLMENAADLNDTFGTKFKADESSIDDRLSALNAGFVRLRNYNGRLSVEANAGKWASLKSKVLSTLQDVEGQIDSLTVSLLNDQGQQVDSTTVPRMFEMSPEDKMNKIEEAVDSVRGGRFSPADEGLPGIGLPSVEETGRAKAARRISSVKKNNPEAVVPQYARDEDGQVIVKPDGTPKTVTLDYNFIDTPVSRDAAKGLKGPARETAATAAVGDKLADLYREVEKNPDIKAGAKWYSTARTRLKKVFGDDAKFFAELLGATSARTPVDINYRFALDAYNQFKSGAYDKVLAKYREGKTKWETGDIADFLKATKAEDPTRGQFIDWWVDKHDLGVTQSSGKKFGMNSRAVLRVLDGSWASEVQGPKTPNFAGNLTGETFEATIDVWAARTLARLANEDGKTRWRILPENETGVTDADFFFGQAAYRAAARKLGIKPDALQAVLGFAEKDHWEKKGWTRGAGAEKSDFNVLLNETERTPEGKLQLKTPQIGLDFGADVGNISKKKK